MSVEEAIIQKLLTTAGVNSLVAQRVFPLSMPQRSARPAITVQKISAGKLYTDEGEIGIQGDRLQIDCWADTWTAGKAVARAVITALSAFDGTVAGVVIGFAQLEDERDDRESGSNAAEYLFRTSLDFLVWYRT